MSRRKSDQMRLPATRLLGSKLFGCCSRHRRAGASGAPATTRTHGARSPGVASNAVASSRGNSCIPRGTKPGPSSLLEIGFGHASARAPSLPSSIFKIPLRRDRRPAPPIANEVRDTLIKAEISLITNLNSLQGGKKIPVLMRREFARKDLVWRLFLLPLTRCGASNR